jgi:alcohol dehydrogenase class IV
MVAGEEVIARIYALVGGMNLPQRLRDAGVKEADLPGLARLALESRAVQQNPKPIANAAQLQEVLEAAW